MQTNVNALAALPESPAVEAQLREVLERFPHVTLGMLFGSVAAGRARAESDLDLAVYAHRPLTVAEKIALTQALAEKTGRLIDLIDLATVAEPLLGQIVQQRMVDAPVAQVQRIGQRLASRRSLHAHVEQLGLIGCQAGFDVAQRLAPRELREGHHAKQIGAAQRAHPGIALVPLDDACEGLPRNEVELDHLRQRLAHVMRHSGSIKPASIANDQSEIQIVGTHETLQTRISIGFAAS